jgi:hypothetical protein
MSLIEVFRNSHEVRINRALLAIGLVGAPTCWAIQLLVNYALSSYSCYPYVVQRSTLAPGFQHVWIEVLIINLLTLGLAVASTLLALSQWRELNGLHPDLKDDLVEASEGRARFISLCGFLTGLGAIAAIIFDLVAILGSPICNVG